MLSNMRAAADVVAERLGIHIFDSIIGYDGIKRTLLRSLNSEEPVHILLVGPTTMPYGRCE